MYHSKGSQFEYVNITKDDKYSILIDAESYKLFLLCDGKFLKEYPVAVGKSKTPSPIGTFTITKKDTWGKGFGGRWLGLSVPWGKYGIHGTIFPSSIGHKASKGCIRMYNKDVAELYNFVSVGTVVTITDGPYGIFGKGFRTLKHGSYGSDVLEVQKKLKEMGYYNKSLNGIFNKSLLNAVNLYLEQKNKPITSEITPEILEEMGFILME